MNIDPSIFKAYDIRGLYPEQVNKETAYAIGRAFAVFVKDFYKTEQPEIVVGYDIRKSSKELFEGIVLGLTEQGCQVIDIGLCSTPLNYFANWYLGVDGSVMITASHNPKDFNGFKLSLRKVMALAEVDGIDDVREFCLAQAEEFIPNLPKAGEKLRQDMIKQQDILPDYLDFLTEKAGAVDFSQFKIAVDCANGMIGPIFQELAEMLNLDYEGLFMEPDGEFPNHSSNPLEEESLISIKELMQKETFDLGILFDGDGDRLRILDSNGEPVKSDSLIGIFAKEFLSKSKKIACDARISRGVNEEIQKLGGEILKSPVGYPNIRRIMREEKCFFGGELALHYFWQDFSYSESALLSLIRLLNILKENTIEELKKPFEKYFSPGEINFKVDDKEGKIREIEQKFSNGEISKLDGLTVEYKDWWFNLRPSNTEPLLRLTLEANSEELFDQKVKELKDLIQN